MPDVAKTVADLVSAPMQAVIVALGTGVASAQRELDRHAIESARQMSEDPVLAEFGLQPTFYQIPRAELDVSIAVALEQEAPGPAQAAAPPAPGTTSAFLKSAGLRALHLQPINAAYANQFNFDVNAASRLRLTIVPVPPPAGDAGSAPRLSQDQVLAVSQPVLEKGGGAATLPSDARLSVTFNAQARLWFVLLYRPRGDAVDRLALAVVDDDTSALVKSDPAI